MIKIPDKTEYETTLEENTYIHVGGKTDKFVPNLNMGKWNDECWLNINHPDIVGEEKESVVDGKTVIKIGDNTHRFYVDDDGDFEYDIVFDKMPKSSKILYSLDFPEGLDFTYQPELTQEEKDFGSERPENVIGSYATYWNNRDNQYKTGKFCHIYRPKLIDNKGSERWAGLYINSETQIMIITCDFEGLEFPVILDPTIGYSTAGASNYSNGSIKVVSWSQASDSGNTDTFHCAVAAVDGTNPGVKLCIYESTGIYAPASDHSARNQNLVEQVEFDVSVSDDESTAAAGASLVSGDYYCLGFMIEAVATKIKYDTIAVTGKSTYESGKSYAAEFADPWSDSASYLGWILSIWVDFSSGGTIYDMSATGEIGVEGSAGISSIISLSGAGEIAVEGSANLTSLISLLGSGEIGVEGSAAIIAIISLSADGEIAVEGTGALNSIFGLSANGEIGVEGQAVLNMIATMAAAGEIAVEGSGNLTFVGVDEFDNVSFSIVTKKGNLLDLQDKKTDILTESPKHVDILTEVEREGI